MLKITSKQADKVHRLVKTCCANCDKDGNCILLDDGEAHRCVQLISIYGIYCNYFKMRYCRATKNYSNKSKNKTN